MQRHGLVILFFGFFAQFLYCGIGCAADLYHNEKYGFSVVRPLNAQMCKQIAPNPNHGVVLLLASQASCDQLVYADAKIEVNGEFNTSESQNVEILKYNICNRRGHTGTMPPNLNIDKLNTRSCMVISANNKIEIWVVAQRQTGKNIDGWINYEVALFTTKTRKEKDLATLRRVLLGIRILSPV